jgi:hypothetical protein
LKNSPGRSEFKREVLTLISHVASNATHANPITISAVANCNKAQQLAFVRSYPIAPVALQRLARNQQNFYWRVRSPDEYIAVRI